MCNLYRHMRSQEEIRRLLPNRDWRDAAGNVHPGDVYPNQRAPIVRAGGEGRRSSSLAPRDILVRHIG